MYRPSRRSKAADITNGFLKFISRKRVGAKSQSPPAIEGQGADSSFAAMLGEIFQYRLEQVVLFIFKILRHRTPCGEPVRLKNL